MCVKTMNTEEKRSKIKKLSDEREMWRTRTFYVMLELAIVFGVFAFGALGLGKFLEANYNTPKALSFGILAVAFIISWVIVFWRYKKIKKGIEKIEEELSEAKS